MEARADLEGKFVILIEDDPLLLELFQELLEGWGCRVATYTDGAQAVADFSNHAEMPDLLFSDYRLPPPYNGLQAIEQIRNLTQVDIPALILTGDVGNMELRDIDPGLGIRVYYKPITPTSLGDVISDILASS